MLELIYATKNPAKLMAMRHALAGLPVALTGLGAVGFPVPEAPEPGHTPLENARAKAETYYAAFGRPLFSCDSGLYFEGVPEALQPGVHVRLVGGRRMSDDEMVASYAALVRRFGGGRGLKARYRNAVCLIIDDAHRFESAADDLAGPPFLLCARPHPKRVEGFPLDSLSADVVTGRYFYDTGARQADDIALAGGYRRFFEKALADLKGGV